jgi:DNA-directed RNA polymerase sigma subunit (sigma70/sigma32)
MTDDEKGLVKRAQKGDAAAFESLYGLHLKRVYNIAWRMMENAADAEDVAGRPAQGLAGAAQFQAGQRFRHMAVPHSDERLLG